MATDPQSSVSVTPLDYAGTATRPDLPPAWRTGALRVVLACWGLPFVVGCVAFLLILLPDKDLRLAMFAVGAYDILIGTGLALVGAVSTLVFLAGRWQPAAGARWPLAVRPAVLAVLLLASNYVVAFGMIFVLAQFLL